MPTAHAKRCCNSGRVDCTSLFPRLGKPDALSQVKRANG